LRAAILLRPASAGLVARFSARLLTSSDGWISSQLFGVGAFSERSRFFGDFARGLSRRSRRFFFRGFNLENKIRGHVVMQLDRHFMFPGGFDRVIQDDPMTINFVAEVVLQPLHEILRRD
jgi:hypothetical protein